MSRRCSRRRRSSRGQAIFARIHLGRARPGQDIFGAEAPADSARPAASRPAIPEHAGPVLHHREAPTRRRSCCWRPARQRRPRPDASMKRSKASSVARDRKRQRKAGEVRPVPDCVRAKAEASRQRCRAAARIAPSARAAGDRPAGIVLAAHAAPRRVAASARTDSDQWARRGGAPEER